MIFVVHIDPHYSIVRKTIQYLKHLPQNTLLNNIPRFLIVHMYPCIILKSHGHMNNIQCLPLQDHEYMCCI